MAKVFIGIPTINRPEFVRQTIRSVLVQTYPDFEVVVSDNCSDPGVADSILGFLADMDDKRVRFHQQSENVGEYGQGRYFLSQAKDHRFFMILHDDDLIKPDYLEKAIDCLNKSPDCVLFFAVPYIIDESGNNNESARRKYLKEHGHNNASQGEIPVLETHLKSGLTPISGTLFRTEILRASGFVDEAGVGNYPFETDIFLRLGDLGVKAWYQKEELLAFRFHSTSMRHYIQLLENEKVVNAMINLIECRHYTGYAERRRKAILGRLFRAKALITVRQGQLSECRKYIIRCFGCNLLSVKLWLVAPIALAAPGLLRLFLPKLPIAREAPMLHGKT